MNQPETGRNPGLIIDSPVLLPFLGLFPLAAQGSHWWELEPVRNWEVESEERRSELGVGWAGVMASYRQNCYLPGLEDV